MITLNSVDKISPIFLTVLLIIYLIIAELHGNNKVKKALVPLLIIFVLVFLIMAVVDVLSKL